METLPIQVFKDSSGPILNLLNEHDLKYKMQEVPLGDVMASSGVIEVLKTAAMWGALATIVVTFIKVRSGRKVIITTKENEVIHAEGLTAKELEQILKRAKKLTAIDYSSSGRSEK